MSSLLVFKACRDLNLGFWAQDLSLGFWAQDLNLGFWAQDLNLGFWAQDLGSKVWHSCFKPPCLLRFGKFS